jgi:hypothetical protein
MFYLYFPNVQCFLALFIYSTAGLFLPYSQFWANHAFGETPLQPCSTFSGATPETRRTIHLRHRIPNDASPSSTPTQSPPTIPSSVSHPTWQSPLSTPVVFTAYSSSLQCFEIIGIQVRLIGVPPPPRGHVDNLRQVRSPEPPFAVHYPSRMLLLESIYLSRASFYFLTPLQRSRTSD